MATWWGHYPGAQRSTLGLWRHQLRAPAVVFLPELHEATDLSGRTLCGSLQGPPLSPRTEVPAQAGTLVLIIIYKKMQTKKIDKNLRAKGPTACQISHLVSIIDSSISLIIGRRPGPDPLNPCVDVPQATPSCSKD